MTAEVPNHPRLNDHGRVSPTAAGVARGRPKVVGCLPWQRRSTPPQSSRNSSSNLGPGLLHPARNLSTQTIMICGPRNGPQSPENGPMRKSCL